MSVDVRIDSASELDAAVCRRLILSTEPWITLGYDESNVQAIVRSAESDNLLVARVEDDIVGFALSTPGILLGEYLKILVVDDAHRSRGVGRKLMESARAARLPQLAERLSLRIRLQPRCARQFYQRLGYEEVGLLKDLLLPGRGEVLMRKSIAAWQRFSVGSGDSGTG